MMLLSKMTKARKKRGRCQIYRDRPVRSKTAVISHAARKPKTETTKIQGINRSKNLNSGRFAHPKTLKLCVTARKLAEFLFSHNGAALSGVDATLALDISKKRGFEQKEAKEAKGNRDWAFGNGNGSFDDFLVRAREV
jgi:hypothetical protein